MSMKKIEFNSDKVKEKYELYIGITPCLEQTINLITKDNPIKIVYTLKHHHGAEVGVEIDYEINSFYIDYFKKQVYVRDPNMPYLLIYDFYSNNISLHGYLYQNDERSVIHEATNQINGFSYIFDINDDDKEYKVNIFSQDNELDSKKFIDKLLNYKTKFNSIKDLFIAINDIVDTELFNIEITDSLNSKINMIYGRMLKYEEYRVNKDNEKDKIYLSDGKFYVEKKVKEECNEEMLSFVKKIGVYNGKEKR